MRAGLVRAVLAVALIAVAVATWVLYLDKPVIPAALASLPVDQTTVLPPAPNETLPPGSFLVASNCPDRIQRGAAWVDLCWGVLRTNDEDPTRDYYALNVGGSFGGPGVRWFVIDLEPIGTAVLDPLDGDAIDGGGCHPLPLGLPLPPGAIAGEQLCGRVVSGPGADAGSWRASWACEPCNPFELPDRAMGLQYGITVPEGAVPAWGIYADLGS